MYVQRNTFIIRPGCMEDAAAMIKAEIERTHADARVLSAIYGPFDQLVLEARFQSLAEFEKFWADWGALPTTQQFGEQWSTLYVPGGSSELWEYAEPVAARGTGKIVNRRTFRVKAGMYEQVLGLLKTNREGNYPYDIETPTFGPNDVVAMDINFESVAAHDKTWQDWGASEQAGPFFEKWFQIIEPGGTNEIWEVL